MPVPVACVPNRSGGFLFGTRIDSRERVLEEEYPRFLGGGKKGGACLEIVSDPSISRGETR
jgi:hypothetical protein